MAEHFVPVPLRHEAGLAAGVVLDLLEGGPAHLLNAPADDADQVVVMRAVELDLEAGGPIAADDRRDEAALLEHLERAKDGGPAHAVRAQGDVDLVLAQVMVGLEEMVEDQAPLAGQAQAVICEMLAEHAHDFLGVLLVVAAFVDDEFSHVDRVPVREAPRNNLVISPCYNHEMKRLWPLPILLLLAAPLRAQSPGEGPDTSEQSDAGPAEEPAHSDESPSEAPPSGEQQGGSDNGGSPEGPPPDGVGPGADGQGADEAAPKEEPIISVKPVSASGEEEESTAPAYAPKKAVPTATLVKPARKARKGASAVKGKGAKGAKGKKAAASAAVKTKAPVVVAAAPPPPPPPPVPVVPLTPMTPRNP